MYRKEDWVGASHSTTTRPKRNPLFSLSEESGIWYTEEKKETPVLLIYKVTSTIPTNDHSALSSETYRVHISKGVEELSIKRSNTAAKISMSMKRAKNRVLKKKKEPLPSSPGSTSSSTPSPVTSPGSKKTFPEFFLHTTRDVKSSKYDSQEYWKEILQMNGGTEQLELGNQASSGKITQSTITNNSTSGGVDTAAKTLLQLKSGVPRMTALDRSSKFGLIDIRSQLKSKADPLETSGRKRSLYFPTTRLTNASPTTKTASQSSDDSDK